MQSKQKFNIFKTAIRGYKHYVTDDYKFETAYIKSLSPEEKEWLEAFISGYYFRNKQGFLKLNFTVSQRRASYNRHRAILNDVFSKCIQMEFNDNQGVSNGDDDD